MFPILRRYFSLPPSLSPQLRSNFTNLFWDIAWWGLYIGSTSAFLTIYAARSGATPTQIGLLTALPALVSLLLSLPTGRWLRRFHAEKATFWAAVVSRSLYLVYALLPWLIGEELQVTAVIGLTILITIPTTVINISFSQFFVEAVPLEWRGMVVGTRIALMSLISFPVMLLCGQILDRLPFPTGYQVVFFIGFIGGILTASAIYRVRPVVAAAPAPAPAAGVRHWLPPIDAPARRYLKIVGILFFFNLTNNMVAPLIPNLLVDKLKLSDATISLGSALSTLLVFLISLRIAWVTGKIGNRRTTAIGSILLAAQAGVLAAANSSGLYFTAVIIGGISSGLIASAQYNYHLDALPDSERSTWLSWNLLLGNVAVLGGALAGPAIAGVIDTPSALAFFGLLRLAVGVLIWVKG